MERNAYVTDDNGVHEDQVIPLSSEYLNGVVLLPPPLIAITTLPLDPSVGANAIPKKELLAVPIFDAVRVEVVQVIPSMDLSIDAVGPYIVPTDRKLLFVQTVL
jgi:hypothetical protein